MKIRARVGIRLGWPVVNAATAVIYVSQAKFTEIANAVLSLQALLSASGDPRAVEIAKRLLCERG